MHSALKELSWLERNCNQHETLQDQSKIVYRKGLSGPLVGERHYEHRAFLFFHSHLFPTVRSRVGQSETQLPTFLPNECFYSLQAAG